MKQLKTTLLAALSAAIALIGLLGCATSDRTAQRNTSECTIKDGKVFDASGQSMPGCVARFDGAMMTMTDRHLVPMKRNMRMSNGTVCVVDGTCVMKDGSKRKLKEGEVLTREGEFLPARSVKVPGRS